MEVWHQKPCSGSYGAHAKVFESHDYCLRSVCYSSLIYLYLQVHCTEHINMYLYFIFSHFKFRSGYGGHSQDFTKVKFTSRWTLL